MTQHDVKNGKSGYQAKSLDKGRLLLVDKPLHWTSFDVVKKIRALLKIKKVGHAGTLDPLATGLLIVCAGKKTKEISSFMELEKTYTGVLEVGKTTPSFDLETEFDAEYEWEHLTKVECVETSKLLVGEIDQVPPAYSAIKIEGTRAYKKAREGQTPRLGTRRVTISRFELTRIDLPVIAFEIVCSKGTYIRSLVNDFGHLLKSGAYLKGLRRTKIGHYDVSDALSIDTLIKDEGLSGS